MASFQASNLAAQLIHGMKRQKEESVRGGPIKLPRMDGGLEDGWTCGKCGNVNYAGRATCNMRSCQAAKPIEAWTCPLCGNQNHENRPFCNMRSCGVAKPGLSAGQMSTPGGQHTWGAGVLANDVGGQHAFGGGVLANPISWPMPVFTPAFGGGGSSSPAGAPSGSWSCMACGNVNFPTRQFCNGKNGTCGVPRWQAEAGGARGKGGGGSPSPGPSFGGGGKGNYADFASMSSPMSPEGSWVCPSCQNVNWPTRMTCNGNRGACNTPRSAAMTPGSKGAAPPTGSWVCTLCSNVNFPTRMTCNGHACGRDRSECDGGPPAAAHVSTERAAAPEGAWTCSLCSNINWPNRLICNARGCGAERTG